MFCVLMCVSCYCTMFFFFTATSPTVIYTLSLHDALPIFVRPGIVQRLESGRLGCGADSGARAATRGARSEEHTSELQSLRHLVCRLLLEKKKTKTTQRPYELTTNTTTTLTYTTTPQTT